MSAIRNSAIEMTSGRTSSTRGTLPLRFVPMPTSNVAHVAIDTISSHAENGIRFDEAAWVYPAH